jgi:acyl-CoA thioesterase
MSVRLHPADLALLRPELDEDPRSGRFEVASGLVRHDGALYGGTGLAVAVLAMQAATGRDPRWATAQFVSQPGMGAVVEWTTEVLAAGRRSAQVSVRATTDGEVVFTALGSTGESVEGGLEGTYLTMPRVAGPEETTKGGTLASIPNPDSYTQRIELREADVLDEDGPPAAIWVRRRDDAPFTPVGLAFAADFVPLAIARAAGKVGAGASLDNSLRFRGGEAEGWVLLELHGDFASGGYGHGTVVIWSEAGELLATGSQTAAMKYLWDEGDEPKLPSAPE